MTTEQNNKPSKPPIFLLLTQIFLLILLGLGTLYAVPRVFSLETDFGPFLGLLAGFVSLCGGVVLVGAIQKTAARILDSY